VSVRSERDLHLTTPTGFGFSHFVVKFHVVVVFVQLIGRHHATVLSLRAFAHLKAFTTCDSFSFALT
jgi:hypothetical protein